MRSGGLWPGEDAVHWTRIVRRALLNWIATRAGRALGRSPSGSTHASTEKRPRRGSRTGQAKEKREKKIQIHSFPNHPTSPGSNDWLNVCYAQDTNPPPPFLFRILDHLIHHWFVRRKTSHSNSFQIGKSRAAACSRSRARHGVVLAFSTAPTMVWRLLQCVSATCQQTSQARSSTIDRLLPLPLQRSHRSHRSLPSQESRPGGWGMGGYGACRTGEPTDASPPTRCGHPEPVCPCRCRSGCWTLCVAGC